MCSSFHCFLWFCIRFLFRPHFLHLFLVNIYLVGSHWWISNYFAFANIQTRLGWVCCINQYFSVDLACLHAVSVHIFTVSVLHLVGRIPRQIYAFVFVNCLLSLGFRDGSDATADVWILVACVNLQNKYATLRFAKKFRQVAPTHTEHIFLIGSAVTDVQHHMIHSFFSSLFWRLLGVNYCPHLLLHSAIQSATPCASAKSSRREQDHQNRWWFFFMSTEKKSEKRERHQWSWEIHL